MKKRFGIPKPIKKENLSENTNVIGLRQLGFIYGSEVLQRAVWRFSHDDILVAMSIKLRNIFLYHFISTLELYSIHSRSSLLRKFFYKMQILSEFSSNRTSKISSLLKMIIYKKSSKEKFLKEKYFNKWKNYGKTYRSKKNVNDSKFCELYKKWTLLQLIKPKRDLIQRLKFKYKAVSKEKWSKNGLYNLLRRALIHKTIQEIIESRRTYLIEKLVLLMMKINSGIQLQNLLNLIKKWRFISFVNVLARKKLELMYKNLHVSYLEMADEVFNGEDIITPIQLQEISKFGGSYKTWDLNDADLIKEIGINPESRTELEKTDDENKGDYRLSKKQIITRTREVIEDGNGDSRGRYNKKKHKFY